MYAISELDPGESLPVKVGIDIHTILQEVILPLQRFVGLCLAVTFSFQQGHL